LNSFPFFQVKKKYMCKILNLSFAVQRSDSRSAKLDELVMDAEKRVVDLSATILNASASSGSLSTTQQKVCSLFSSM
jgi:hypothetical protein